MQDIMQDIRCGFRTLIRNPGLTIVILVTLALGIGANSGMFSIINGVLLTGLPYEDADRIVRINAVSASRGLYQAPFSPLGFTYFQNQSQSFENMASFWDEEFTLTGGDRPETIRGAFVSANFFAVLKTKFSEGREFAPGADRPGSDHIVTSVITSGRKTLDMILP